jgi:nicotinamide mononucleotide transporter
VTWILNNWLELSGNGLSFLCIFLISRNSLWNWPVGIANCILYIAAFWPAKLYADCGVQVMYICLSVYGIWNWLRGGEGKTRLAITRASKLDWAWLAAMFVGLFGGLQWVLRSYTDSDVPFQDAGFATVCILATIFTARRKVECWWLWILANIGYFFLYGPKGLVITQWCQVPFLLLSALGLRNWLREFHTGILLNVKLPAESSSNALAESPPDVVQVPA